MKHVLLFIFISASLFTTAQTWAPEGATWHYNFTNGFAVEGYVKIERVGDTLINGISCDKLQRESNTYDFVNEEYSSGVTGLEFTYEEDSVVYFYHEGEFYTLYDFTAEAGDIWSLPGEDLCEADQVVVDSVEMVEIDGEMLKKLYIHSAENNQFLGDEIIAKLGSQTYMFPTPYCVTDVNEGGPFRCYSDNTGFAYTVDPETPCDFIVAVTTICPIDPEVNIFPNPTTEILNISAPLHIYKDTKFVIFNSFGEIVKIGTINSYPNRIDVSDLSSGVYISKLGNGDDSRLKRFVVK
ncbi:T9SS type A sorting domain-containing protein [Halocola ammonii]